MYVCVRVRVCVRKPFMRKEREMRMEREKKEKRKNKETGEKRKHKLLHTDRQTTRQTETQIIHSYEILY